jgi:hypothetical protein
MPVAYLVGDARRPRVVEVAPKHAAYWQGLDLPGYEGGPFEDRAGGLIVFGCESLDDARDRGVTSERSVRRARSSAGVVAQAMVRRALIRPWLKTLTTWPTRSCGPCGLSLW